MSENLEDTPRIPPTRRPPRGGLTALVALLALSVFVILTGAIGWFLAPAPRVVVATRTPLARFTPGTGNPVPTPVLSPSATLPPQIPSPIPTVTPSPRTHEVQTGDTLVSIAAEYRVSYESLKEMNRIDDPNRIFVGQKLILPPSAPTPMPGSREHVVQEGETLFIIAIKYDVSVDDILKANGETDPDMIFAGQKLIIPPVRGTATTSPD